MLITVDMLMHSCLRTRFSYTLIWWKFCDNQSVFVKKRMDASENNTGFAVLSLCES